MKNLGLVALAALLGALAVQCLTYMTNFLGSLCYLGAFSIEAPDISNSGLGMWMTLIPVVGAIAGVLLIKFRKKWFTPLSAFIMTGTGFPFGVEGILASGLFLLGDRKLLKAAVLTSGLACLFNAPVAAAVLVFELGFIELSLFNVLAIVLAAGIGASLRFVVTGWDAVLQMEPLKLSEFKLATLYVCFTGGIIVFLFGRLMTWLIKKLEQINFQREWLPVVAALIIGYLGWLRPEGLGTGQYFISDIASGQFNLLILVGLSFVRLAMVILAAGTRAPGREVMITPMIIIGAVLGMFAFLLVCLPTHLGEGTPGIAAVAGIAVLLTGNVPVIFAALILPVELTHQWIVLIPVMTAMIPAILIRKVIVETGTN